MATGLVSVVVGLERSCLVEAHVLGLVIAELRQMGVERGQVEAGHELVHQLGHQVDVSLVATGRSVVQLCNQIQKLATGSEAQVSLGLYTQ